MAIYDIFLRKIGVSIRKIQIHCQDDLDALDAARALARAREGMVEVYEADRFVARVKKGDEVPNARDGRAGCSY